MRIANDNVNKFREHILELGYSFFKSKVHIPSKRLRGGVRYPGSVT